MVPGTSLKDRYVLGRNPLAHKGMGEVWPARDTLLDRQVIVKFVSAASPAPEAVRRFRREALLTARLDHPGVPAVYDLGHETGRPYVVFQKIDGVTLTDLVAEQGPLPFGWVAAIGAQISSVLLAARRIGLVHRDLKPSNVMLDTSGAVKVLDFGLAAIHGDDRYSRITQSGQSLGTVGYMAPEQILAEPTDHRTDLYGLGATLFDLLTGRPPFDGVTTMTTVRHQLDGPAPRPARLRPDTPAELDDLVHALLAIDPRDRPASVADVYPVLAPLSLDRPPISGVLTDTAEAVQSYAAIVGRVPQQTRPTTTTVPGQPEPGVELTARKADQLHAAGEFRAAARLWRRLADQRAEQHGDDDPAVFDLRLRAARAHVALGEHRRAMRQLQALLDSRVRADGPDHPDVPGLRQEIARLTEQGSPSSPHSRSTPGVDH
ncbi:serine/threonine-protein kinase [Micromonospora sp. WMMD956]|uniref:serine/threonine-protein kinase n=1 Tax=Micromonospora sp. WMMD956 TaxID=3016108 RepID=UPI002417A658|nr:serine/threonine-protein kinase [Micromonospora sp. WMMD956]MDG4816794.1 serine/threonine-protein kinase [Micromonospora sp. WMMD956]